MLTFLAWKNLCRQRLRFFIAVGGVVFAVVLVSSEIGMLLGLMKDASVLIDRSRADIWVSVQGVKTFDFVTPMDFRNKLRLRSVPGVEYVEEFNISWSVWRLANGSNNNCLVVGFDPRGKLAAPLDMHSGSIKDLNNRNAIIVDRGECGKLGNPDIGDVVEVFEKRARIVGFTQGMRSFTTTPFVFTSLKRGKGYGWLAGGIGATGERSVYFLVKTEPGADTKAVCRRINESVHGVHAHTKAEFSFITRKYWLVETGMGIGFLVAAILGFAVGGAIVSQTLFMMTSEKLPEFGVLKAIGANMRELSQVVVLQGGICGALGLVVGLGLSLIMGKLAEGAGTAILLPWPLLLAVSVKIFVLCLVSTLASIYKLRNIEPAQVFQT